MTQDNYPALALRLHHQGVATVELTVDTQGQLANCRIAISTGWQELDDATCAMIRARARYAPARDDAGQPLAYVYRLRFRWVLPGSQPPTLPPDTELDLNVAAFPKDMVRPIAGLTFIVAPDGKIESCSVPERQSSGSPALDKAGCAAMSKSETFQPALDGDGRPMRFMRVQQVGFTIDRPK
ncbi:TonB family protein [Sphingomonas crusticola]|uniref:TonB family protein n=1 Tax=Sphingomonas crusticola TaxID=1697973 RepID=UPI0013C34B15|nr:TonB family protein [Sphingomonas crusticola]